jgi:general secretion pathway protein A
MYLDFFGFREKPFAITPNPRFIFLSKNHKEVFAHLLYGIRSRCGFIEVTGEVGTGKTTVLRTLLNQLEDDAYRLAFIFNPSLSVPELLRSINREFDIPCIGKTHDELLSALNDFLLRENAEGRTVVLVIDEAQNLEPAVLEQIRLLSNLETETDKLIQIVLVGQPELGQVLSRPDLRQLSQRITVRYHLRSMDFEDARAYIRHRLEVAGGRGSTFTPRAVKKIYRYSAGLPRLINVLCDRALLSGYAEDARIVSAATVSTAIRELRRQSYTGNGLRRLATAAGCLLFAIPVIGGYLAMVPRLVLVCLGLAIPVLGGYLALGPKTAPSAFSPPVVADKGSGFEVFAPVDPESLRRQLAGFDEAGTAVKAFNALAALWGAEPLAEGKTLTVPDGLQGIGEACGLLAAPFRGSLENLIHLNTPALLEITLSGASGSRYLALTEVADGRARVAPGLAGGSWLDLDSLRRLWSGSAYLLWKNYRDLPTRTLPGASGEEIVRLQELLREVGAYALEPSGVYDDVTIAAVKNFQARQGIAEDGRVGPQTLMLLYQKDGNQAPPRICAEAPKGGA